jgi:hypothetical protein
MILLPLEVWFLSAFINNTLFIQTKPDVGEAFICFSKENVYNDTWPFAWKQMETTHLLSIDNKLFTYKINNTYLNESSLIRYKLRFNLHDKSHRVTEWNLLYSKPYRKDIRLYICIILVSIFVLFFICILAYILYCINKR